MTDPGTRGESHISADGETIRDWADEHPADLVPARRPSGAFPLALVPEDRLAEGEAVSWDEFLEELDRRDAAVVYHGPDAAEPFEVTGQETAIERATAGAETVEGALLEGETVTTEVTETTVVERTVVEEAELESEVTGREVVEERIVGGSLRAREFDCQVAEPDSPTVDRAFRAEQFSPGHEWDEPITVEVDTAETWVLTKEVFVRVTVETEVVDTDVTETDTVRNGSVEREVDIEGVQRDILDSGLVETDASTTEVIESGSIQSETGEGQVVHTELLERRTYDEEVTLHRRYAGDLPGVTTDASTVDSDLVASSIVDSDEVEFEMETVVDTATGVETAVGTDDRERTTGSSGGRETGSGRGVDSGRGTDSGRETDTRTTGRHDTGPDTRSDIGSDTEGDARHRSAGNRESAVVLDESDEGKPVVDATGERVGIVTGVGDEALYVDPDPSLTDRIRTALDWGDSVDERDQPIPPERIDAITETRVELTDRVGAGGERR